MIEEIVLVIMSQGFTAVNRHHDQGKSYKKRTFNWGWLTGSEVQSIIIKVEAWQPPGRHVAGGAESSTSSSEGHQEKTVSQAARRLVLQPTPTVTHFLQQGHTYSNKATPPNSATPCDKYFQTTIFGILDLQETYKDNKHRAYALSPVCPRLVFYLSMAVLSKINQGLEI